MTCTHDCAQGRVCKCDALLGELVQTTRDAGCCDFDLLPDYSPSGWKRTAYWAAVAAYWAAVAAYWAAVGLGAGFAATLVFFAPAAWVWAKVGG